MLKEKIKIKTELSVTLFVILAVTLLVFWSAWFGHYHAQTGMQYLASSYGNLQVESQNGRLVFLGDSLTAREDWNVLFETGDILNDGKPGDTTDDVLARLDTIFAANTAKPQKIFLMVGINDLLRGRDILYVLANYQKIIKLIKLRSPSTQIFIQSVLPINNGISQMGNVDSGNIIALNGKLSSLDDGKNIFFLNLYPNFCDTENQLYPKYTVDGVHLNAAGYATWKNSIASYL